MDSVVYIQPRDEHKLVEMGDCLGGMTFELKPGHQICEFVTAGPKNYAYKTVDAMTGEQKTECKVREITLNYSASRIVNSDKIRDMILNRDDRETVTVRTEKKIMRKREDRGVNIITEPEENVYRVSFLKRRRLRYNPSIPFGFIS